MTAGHPDALSSRLIEFPDNYSTTLASHTRMKRTGAVLIAIAIALFIIGGTIGVGMGGALAIFAAVFMSQRSYVATFDLAQRQVTVVTMTLLSTCQRTLAFDAIQWLDFNRGDNGTALFMKDGSMLTVSLMPVNYAEFDCRLAEIRSRTRLQPARVDLTHAATLTGVTSDQSGLITITSGKSGGISKIIGGLVMLLFSAVYISCVILFLPTASMPKTFLELFGFSIILLGVPLIGLMGIFGVNLLFSRPSKLLLDPTTRQLHFDSGFGRRRPNDMIAFADIAIAGVIHDRGRDGSSFTPYIQLQSDRAIRLNGFGFGFRRADEVADLVRQMTGAARKNIG